MERFPAKKFAKLYLHSCQHSQNLIACRDVNLARHFSTTPQLDNREKGFFSRFVDNLKSDLFSNKEMRENLEKFRQEREKLEETEAIKQAREKFKQVEEESMKEANEVLKSAKESIKSGVKIASEADIVKKTIEIGGRISSRAKDAADEISKQGEFIKETTAYKTVSSASRTVEKELDDAEILTNLYQPPKVLQKRSERAIFSARVVKPNEDESSVELHKDSVWSQNWKKFKDENQYFNKLFEYKMKYDESDNPVVRVTRNLVDKVTEVAGGLFKTTDLSKVLTEIRKIDPTFDINEFLKDCEKYIVPNILESMIQDNQEVLSDWCHEAVYNVLSTPLKEAKKLNLKYRSKILDIQNFDLALGKMMEQGPVIVITFQAQQITYVEDTKGNVVQGDADKVVQYHYVMAFCRDQNDLDPNTAWKLIDVAMQETKFSF